VLDLVVLDHVVEEVLLLQLVARELEPLLDLALALGGTLAQPPLVLFEARRPDEDRDRSGDALRDCQCAFGLEIEQRDAACVEDPVDLRAQRAIAVARVLDVLEEGALRGPALELLLAQEVVVDAVGLPLPAPPGGRRDRDLELGEAGKDALDERSLPRARWSRDDDDPRATGYR
jgi:hypothetical protein